MILSSKTLHQSICNHILGWNIIKNNLTIFNSEVNEMIVKLDMFGVSVIAGILCECDSSLVIT